MFDSNYKVDNKSIKLKDIKEKKKYRNKNNTSYSDWSNFASQALLVAGLFPEQAKLSQVFLTSLAISSIFNSKFKADYIELNISSSQRLIKRYL